MSLCWSSSIDYCSNRSWELCPYHTNDESSQKDNRNKLFFVMLKKIGHSCDSCYTISSYYSKEGTSGVCIENHDDQTNKDETIHEIPRLLSSNIICKESWKHDEKCSHRIWSVEDTLEPSYICSINSIKYRRSTSKLPCRRISRVSNIKKKILWKRELKKSTHKKHGPTRDKKYFEVIWEGFLKKRCAMICYPKCHQKFKVISSTIDNSS